MVLIPSDIGVRLRLQNEAQLLQPATPVTEIPSDLPQLRLGQTFSARIQEALPENTYKALVAGKSLTLSLPEGAKPGDTLELVVIDRSPKVVVAQFANAPSSETGITQTYPYTNLSQAGQLIGSLLTEEGEAPAAVPLGRGQPLLTHAPVNGAQLAPALADAVKASGLFYESHQAQWATGRLPLPQLLQEPQAQHSNPATLISAGIVPPRLFDGDTEKSALAGRRSEPPPLLESLFRREAAATTPRPQEVAVHTTEPTLANTATPAAKTIPDELRPVVQQQLDALATQRLAWHGEVWPQQTFEWDIEWQHGRQNGDEDEESFWTTHLALTTPRLGEVQARLQLNDQGVRIALITPYGATAADLREALPALDQSLAAAGVPLLGFNVKHDDRSE